MYVMTEREVWSANKKALVDYVPCDKDLKVIWERDPKKERIIRMFEPLRHLGTEESISFLFAGKERKFYVLNIGNKNISQFHHHGRATFQLTLPALQRGARSEHGRDCN
jgi:hypothetical protein